MNLAEKKEVVGNKNQESSLTNKQTEHLVDNAAIYRSELLRTLLDAKRNINYECGYPEILSINNYQSMYDREGAGTRVVKILPEESWALLPDIYETEESDETEFERKWDAIQKELNVFHYLQRIDILSGIGAFGVLLLGINDGKELNEPVEGINLRTGEKEGSKEYELLYLKPFSEYSITISSKEKDTSSPRYGFPVMYSVNFEKTEAKNTSQTLSVHWTRVIHIADNREASDVFGIPRMKPVFNRLWDVKKILASSGEMFWKGAFPGYSFEVDPEYAGQNLDVDSLKTQFENYSNGLQRFLALVGVKAKSLEPQVSSPKDHVETQYRAIAISMGIPYRIFLGTEEAKLASSQDIKTWNKRLKKRQEGYVSPMLIRPFIDRLITFGILPEVEEYFVTWPDLNAPSDEEKANVAKSRTEAMAKYVVGNVDNLIAPEEYLTKILGFTKEETDAILEATTEYIEKEIVTEEKVLKEKQEVPTNEITEDGL